ncbi:hypothetical protein [Nitrospira sp. M1]
MKSLILLLSTALCFSVMILVATVAALPQSTTIAPEKYLGEVVIPEAIKGFDEQKVQKDPICDSSMRPKI